MKRLGKQIFSVTSVKGTKIGKRRFVTVTRKPLVGSTEKTFFVSDGPGKFVVEKTKSIVGNTVKAGVVGTTALILIGVGLESMLPANFMGS